MSCRRSPHKGIDEPSHRCATKKLTTELSYWTPTNTQNNGIVLDPRGHTALANKCDGSPGIHHAIGGIMSGARHPDLRRRCGTAGQTKRIRRQTGCLCAIFLSGYNKEVRFGDDAYHGGMTQRKGAMLWRCRVRCRDEWMRSAPHSTDNHGVLAQAHRIATGARLLQAAAVLC